MYILYQYNLLDYRLVFIPRLIKSNSLFQKFISNNSSNTSNSEDVLRCSLSRTKRHIRELAICNDWDYFRYYYC